MNQQASGTFPAATARASWPVGNVLGPARATQQTNLTPDMPLSWLFCACCFFPYLTLIRTNTDLQPYALMVATVVCLTAIGTRWPREILMLAIAPIASFAVWLAVGPTMFGFRETLTFSSPLIIGAATYVTMKRSSGLIIMRRFLIVSAHVWLLFGLVEFLFNPHIVESLIPNISSDRSRGVVGLATEPSFYGLFCIAMLALNYTINNNNKYMICMLLFQIIVLAQSSLNALMLILFGICAFATLFSWRVVVFGSLGFLAIWGSLVYVLPRFADYRLAYVMQSLLSDPLALLWIDKSVNARVGHSLFSVLAFLENIGLPRGFGDFGDYVVVRSGELSYVWLGDIRRNLKIMSGYGSALYEIGLFGLSIPVVAGLATARYFWPERRKMVLAVLYLTTVMFFAIQVSLPLFGMLIGCFLAKAEWKAADPGAAPRRNGKSVYRRASSNAAGAGSGSWGRMGSAAQSKR